jgi:hypothetical protein
MRLAGTAAVSCDAFTNVVDKGLPFHVTTVPELNPEPFTVSVKAEPPAIVEFGERLLSVSAWGVMVNVSALDVTLPFCAVIDAVPG